MQPPPTDYDLVSYPGYTHLQTHPERLAVIGSLYGLTPVPVTHCRVLELGCGMGSNLVPMAFGLPASHFMGIDYAEQPIAQGRQMIRELGLKNVELLHGSITGFDASLGKFDYIIAHGFYSWVPAEVRTHLLSLCRSCLAPHGIAFISYNALPGSHLRNMLREMMLFHVRDIEAPQEIIAQAQSLARFLADAQETKDEYRLWMKSELDHVLGHEPGQLYHDELAKNCDPFYFTQFIQQAGAHRLKYLGEADFFEMSANNFKETTRNILNQLGPDRILREQYLDFLKCRRFRQTLVCHDEALVQSSPQREAVTRFFIASSAQCLGGGADLSPSVTSTFATKKGIQCATNFPLGKAALTILGANEFSPVSFDELMTRAAAQTTAAGIAADDDTRQRESLSAFLTELYGSGMVEFHSWQPACHSTVSDRPVASKLARWQVQHGNFVTSPLHLGVKIEDEIGRLVLSSLDGTNDQSALVEKIWDLVKSKNSQLDQEGRKEVSRRKIEMDLRQNLEMLARIGLLVA